MLDKLEEFVRTRRLVLSEDSDRAKLQLAVLYYWIKAVRAARAASHVAAAGYLVEGLLLQRGLYNLVVDCLWMCADPVPRTRLFYDSTAVAFERWRTMLGKAGAETFDVDTQVAINANREHHDRVVEKFQDRKGRVRVEWAPGSIRDRVNQLATSDPELQGLADVYDLLYGMLSDYEHSAPILCFQFVQRDDREIFAVSNPMPMDATAFGRALGVLLGSLVLKTMTVLGLTRDAFRELKGA